MYALKSPKGYTKAEQSLSLVQDMTGEFLISIFHKKTKKKKITFIPTYNHSIIMDRFLSQNM